MEGNCLSVVAPRVLLLHFLSENVEKLRFEIGQQKWPSFCSGLVVALEAMRDEVLRGVPPYDSELKKVVQHVFEKEYNVVVLWEEIRKHCAKMKDSSDEYSAVHAVETAVALLVHAMDKHVLAFFHENPYEGSLVALLSGSELPRRGSTWDKFLETYNRMLMPATQQFSVLATGLVLSESLINRLQHVALIHPAPQRTRDATLTEDKVFFVTDRPDVVPSMRTSSRLELGGSFEELSYGDVTVGFEEGGTIPTSPIEDIPYISQNFMGKDYTTFIQSINSHLALLDEEAGNASPTTDVLLFIHGFLTKFGEGDIRRAAQVKHDMNLFGTSIAYCWNSQSTVEVYGYCEDEKAVDATIPYLASFIKLCITQVKARRLHVLAHSMGNRAMIGALRQIYAEIISNGDGEWIRTGLPLKNVISAAADWTMREFQGMVEEAKEIFGEEDPTSEHRPHFSVYTSRDDRALLASTVLHNDEGIRLGLTDAHFQDDSHTLEEPPETGFIDVIDATSYDQHMYFASEADVLHDMQQLISVLGKERAYFRADGTLITNVAHRYEGKEFDFYSFSPSSWDIPS